MLNTLTFLKIHNNAFIILLMEKFNGFSGYFLSLPSIISSGIICFGSINCVMFQLIVARKNVNQDEKLLKTD